MNIAHQQPAVAHSSGKSIGTSAVTVGDRDMERIEAETAPAYVPLCTLRETVNPAVF